MSSLQPTFAEKRKEWLKVLNGEDRNSIINQIIQMTWDAASFRIVNEARRLAPADPDSADGGVKINGLMHSLLNRGFFISQKLAIRRLTDTYPLDGERGVYSLTGLLDDMQKHHGLFTRKAIFDAEGLEYDYEPIRQKFDEYAGERIEAGEKPDEDDGHDGPAYIWPKWRDESINRLAGVAPDDRHPEDIISEGIFKNLRKKVDTASKDVITHVDKFIAHAATLESRDRVNADEAGITLNHLWKAHQVLCEVAGFLAVVILGDSNTEFLLIPQFDQLKYIDQPLVESSRIKELRGLWREFDRNYHDWSQWTLDDYDQEFGDKLA